MSANNCPSCGNPMEELSTTFKCPQCHFEQNKNDRVVQSIMIHTDRICSACPSQSFIEIGQVLRCAKCGNLMSKNPVSKTGEKDLIRGVIKKVFCKSNMTFLTINWDITGHLDTTVGNIEMFASALIPCRRGDYVEAEYRKTKQKGGIHEMIYLSVRNAQVFDEVWYHWEQ